MMILVAFPTIAAGPFTSLHPEEAIPDPPERMSSGPYAGFISRVQERLRALGFDAGPVNGDFGTKTQAALAQFQLSRTIPAGGQLDDQTLAELGVERDPAPAAAGASAPPSATAAIRNSPTVISAERTAEPKPPGELQHKPEPPAGR